MTILMASKKLNPQKKEKDYSETFEDKTIALFRIGDVPRRPCDDSPFEGIIYSSGRGKMRLEEFIFDSENVDQSSPKLTRRNTWVQTSKKGTAKLTNVYKRNDNFGSLLQALKRMKMNL